MKRALNIASVVTVILAILLIFFLFSSGSRTQVVSESSRVAFAAFPLDQPRVIELSASDEALRQLSRREYSDQIKDWLLTTIISDAGLSPAELNQSLFDLPPVRYGYIRPVGTFEYGDTRSRSIGKGRLVTLIPKTNSAGRLDVLAQIADEARKNTGDKPATLIVFEYEVSPDNLSAEVTRRADVDGHSLFTEANGYFEVTANGLDDLRRFTDQVDDLTFARLENGVLRLGGRKLHNQQRHNLTIDDVAALWSAQTKLRTKNQEFENFVAQKRKEFEDRWSGRRYRNDFERASLETQMEADGTQVRNAIDQERQRLGVVAHTGFSLDPSFVYSRVKSALEGPIGRAILSVSENKISSAELSNAADRAGNGELDAFYSVLQKLEPDVARKIVQLLQVTCGYQAARYDGALQGTEVGMVLFYTDLLAKLWALDFISSAPDKHISGFHAMAQTVVSRIYEKEMDELPSTRLWFGVQSRGFALKNDGSPSIILAPVATRLYAASSDSLTPGKEVAPNAASAAFLGWWDDHYAEVARYEPEYERLNEIMKWSIVISWLDQEGQLERLSALRDVTFRKDNWFPEWVRKHPDLRFQRWDRIQFYPRGYTKTEALPLLRSDENVPMPLMGGVSLAEREIFQTRGAISKEIAEIGRRPTLNWSETTPNAFRTIEGAEYKFAQTADRYTVDATLKPGIKFRGVESEVADLKYSRSIAIENSAIRMEARNGGVGIGELKIEPTSNGFRVGWQSREFDTATSLARRMATEVDPVSGIASDPRVAAAVQTGEHDFLVRLRGSSNWLKLAAEQQPSATIAEGWQSRVAALDPRAKNINMAWYDGSKAAAELEAGGYIRVHPGSAPAEGVRMQLEARPPRNVVNTSIRIDGRSIKVQRNNASRDYFVRWSDLPPEVRQHPELLRGITGEPDSYALLHEFDELAAGRYEHAAQDLARSPLSFKAALDEHYLSGLRKADTLLSQGDDAQTLRVLDDMARVHGNTPEISLRKAIAFTRNANPDRAVRALNDTLKVPMRDRNSLFTEINARIRNAHSGVEQDNLYQLAAFGDWNDLTITGKLRHGTPVPAIENGKFQIEYHAAAAWKGTRVSDLPSAEAPIYVQDSPALSNLDSPAAIQQALHAGVRGRLPIVIEMTQEDIAHFRPAKIYMPDGKTALKKVETSNNSAGNIARQGYRAFGNQPCSSDDDSSECKDKRQPVYVVMDSQDPVALN